MIYCLGTRISAAMSVSSNLPLFTLYLLICISCVFCATDCPVGWVVGYDECYLFHQNPLTWQDAMVYCRSRRAHLAKIETEQERSLIQNIIEQDLPGIYWLGGKDDAIEGDWRWQPSNEVVNETFWNHGEPDQFTGNEDCLTTSEMEQGLWNDRACGNYYGFICEQS
ncbi:perlucin-like protein [Mytilus trossulus]|uniref:perlucin-like protein n=1 Tax=Mytilus trossulus TaxID=6551 RepID=UPI0030052895